MKIKIQIFFLLIFIACSSNEISNNDYALLDEIPVADNQFGKRIFKDSLYTVLEKKDLPDYVGNVYQIKVNPRGIYLSDKESIHKYQNGKFETAFTPSKGRGPKEVPQIFRFDLRDDVVSIAGYPDTRVLLHQLQTDTLKLIKTQYRGNVLIDDNFNFYGEHTGHSSGYMFTKFNTEGDSLYSFGKLFHNQDKSLNMFDLYWDYNEKHDLIIIGFMYVGYYVAIDLEGNVKYTVESIRHPGRMPVMVNRGGSQYVDDEGKVVLRGISTAGNEIHVYTANAKDEEGNLHGALIDVLDIESGEYKLSYLLNDPLHWPIFLQKDYKLVSVTENYELVKWKRKKD